MRKEGLIAQMGRMAALGLLILSATYAPITPTASASQEVLPENDICTILPNGELMCVPSNSIKTTVDAPSQVTAAEAQILNGKSAGHVPLMGALLLKKDLEDYGDAYYANFAGAVIVDKDAVLLETHTTYDENERPFRADELCVGYGTNNLDQMSFDNGNIQCGLDIQRIIVDDSLHNGYSLLTLTSDIGTNPAVQERYPVQYAQLVTSTDVLADGTPLQTYGYGVINEVTMESPHSLRKADIVKNPFEICSSYISQADGTYITAGDGHNKVDSAVGDSSGPLVFSPDGIRLLTIGLNSFGPYHNTETYDPDLGIVEYACGHYLDLSAYAPQIETLIGIEDLSKVYATSDTFYYVDNLQQGVFHVLPYSVLKNDRRAWEITGISTIYKVESDGSLKATNDVTIDLYTNGTGGYTFYKSETESEYLALAIASNREGTETQTVSIRLVPFGYRVHLPAINYDNN